MKEDDLVRIAKLIASMFSPTVETVVHDMSKTGFPIIAIFNNVLSGRNVGDSTDIFGNLDNTDLMPDDLINYTFTSKTGKTFRSSSILFNSDNNSPHLGLSINFDKEPIQEVSRILSELSNYVPQQVNLNPGKKKLFLSEDDLTNEVKKVLVHYNKSKDIEMIITQLSQINYFDHHKSITVLGKILGVTRPTIYKYLHKAHKE